MGTPDELKVVAALNDATSRLTASVTWKSSGGGDLEDVDQWQITINNLSWEQNDFVYHHWVYYVDKSKHIYC